MTELVSVNRERLDALARRYMDEIHDRCGHEPMSLDEFLVQYPLCEADRMMGVGILALYPEYGGECGPEG